MQDNNIDNIISKILLVNKDKINRDTIKLIIEDIRIGLTNNNESLNTSSAIDKKNNNGFIIDVSVINNIFDNILKEDIYYGDVTLSMLDKDKKLIYGHELMDIGNVVVIYDGNPYVTIEMVIRNMIAGNKTILCNNGYMYGTNKLILEILYTVLEKYNISKDIFQLYITEEYDKLLDNYANIDVVICIGNHNLQNLILNKSKNRVITSGYECFDLYIEDDSNLEFINKIIDTGLNINVYVNNNIKLDNNLGIEVNDIDEAIGMINYSGHKYSAGIFTNNKDNASKFIKEVKSKIVTVNTSPTIERIIDIKQNDLMNEKTIIYPASFKFDNNRKEISISDII